MARYEDLPYRTCVGMMLINQAGRVFIVLTRLTASSSVLVGSVFGSLLKPIWLSLICTKLNELVFSAASADEMRRETGTPPPFLQRDIPLPQVERTVPRQAGSQSSIAAAASFPSRTA